MNKLEELKALLNKYEEALRVIRFVPFDSHAIQAHKDAHFTLQKQAVALLPDLIAVAEAAEKIDWPNVYLKNYEERILVNVLQDALLSLTKDADK